MEIVEEKEKDSETKFIIGKYIKDESSFSKNSYIFPIRHFHSCAVEKMYEDESKYKELSEKLNKEKKIHLASVGIIMDNKVNSN